MESEGKHPKQDFQVERIAFFSDAVFAIALTLLVLEFKPPIIKANTTTAELWVQLDDLKYKGVALIVSFTLIVSFWMRHHTLFKHIHNYNKPIIVTNMLLFLPIIFFPFTTAFLYESVNSDNPLIIIPVRLFFLNTVLAGAVMYVLYFLIIVKYKEHSYPMDAKEEEDFKVQLLLMTISFSLIVILSFINNRMDVVTFSGVLPLAFYNVYRKVIKRFKRKKRNDRQNHSAANT